MSAGAIRFGPFHLDPARKLLLRDGEAVRLGGRALDILIALLEQPGAVVEKARLMEQAWPGIHVDEANLRSQMAALRRALGDGQDGARYIISVAGRGYAFVAPTGAGPSGAAAPELIPRPHPLPVRLTPVIGQEETIAALAEKAREQRFVTIFGAGGIGKTTVAVAVAQAMADHFRDPPCFVDFGVLTNPALAVGHVAAALGAPSDLGGKLDSLAAYLAGRNMLILLDSCEPVIEAAVAIAEAILKAAPRVHVLATSRERLRGEGEWSHRLASMEIPPPHTALDGPQALRWPALRLFIDRVQAAGDAFTPDAVALGQIAEICRRLDGIPLAIELAASRVAQLGLDGLAERLDARFGLLMKGRRTALPRHQTLRATLDWSFQLLPEHHQAVLCRLSVFRGGFARDAAVEIGRLGQEDAAETLEVLAELADRSLIVPDTSAPITAYRCLDTTRVYLAEKLLERGEAAITASLHAAWYLALFEAADETWRDPAAQQPRLQMGFHIDNLRGALDWAIGSAADCRTGVALTLAALPLWSHFALFEEATTRVRAALALLQADAQAQPRQAMRLSAALGAMGFQVAAPDQVAMWTATLALAEQLDDTEYQLRALAGLSTSAILRSQRESLVLARRYRDLAARRGWALETAKGDRMVAYGLHLLGDQRLARRTFEAVLRDMPRAQDRRHLNRFNFDEHVLACSQLSKVLWLQGEPQRALALGMEGVREALALDHGNSLFSAIAINVAAIAMWQGGLDQAPLARDLLFNQLSALAQRGLWAVCYRGLEAARQGDARRGLALLRSGMAGMAPASFALRFGPFRSGLAECLLSLGEPAAALAELNTTLATCAREETHWFDPEYLRLRALAQQALGAASPEVEATLRQSLALAEQQGALAWELRAATTLATVMLAEARPVEACDLLAPVLARFDASAQSPDLDRARRLLDRLGAEPTPHPSQPVAEDTPRKLTDCDPR